MNKQGYTLIELLAVIILLGLISTISYTGISKYLNNARNTTYKDYENNLKVATETYLISNSSKLPTQGNSIIIDGKTLKNGGFIEMLKDPFNKKKDCNNESYVIITRNNNNNYNMSLSYQVCLICGNYKSNTCN